MFQPLFQFEIYNIGICYKFLTQCTLFQMNKVANQSDRILKMQIDRTPDVQSQYYKSFFYLRIIGLGTGPHSITRFDPVHIL